MTTARPFTSYSPDASDFNIPSSALERAAFIPAPASKADSRSTRRFSYASHRPTVRCPRWLRPAVLRCNNFVENNSGLLLIASAQLFFALMNVAVKLLNSTDVPMPTLELVFVRMLITYVCCILYMLLMGVPDPWIGPKGVRILLVTRGFSGFFGLFGVYYSLKYLSLSDVTVLTFLAPLTTAIAGALILKETFTLKQGIAGIFSLIGVILIARPQFLFGAAPEVPDHGPVIDGGHGDTSEKGSAPERVIAVGLSLLGVLGGTGAALCMRTIGKRAHAVHSLTSFSAYCVLASGIAMIWKGTELVFPTRTDWLLMLLFIGLVGFVAQTMVTLGLQRETVSRGSMGNYVQIIFATAFERMFFHTTPSSLSIFGTLIILSSAIYVAVTKESDPAKNSEVRLGSADEVTLEEGLLSSPDEEDRGGSSEQKDGLEMKEYTEKGPEL